MNWLKALVKLIWIGCCGGVLVWMYFSCGQQADQALRGECHLLAAGIMVLLTFPIGIIWFCLVSAIGYVLSGFPIQENGPSLAYEAVTWLGFLAVGYLQWLKLFPLLIARWKTRKSKGDVKPVVRR